MRYGCLVFFVLKEVACFMLLPHPEIAWSAQLIDSTVRGNAVVYVNEEILAVTTASGVLHLISKGAKNHTTVAYTPDAVAGFDSIICQSSAIVMNDVVVYAVTHTDVSHRVASSSRIVAVNAMTGIHAWSLSIDGVVAGTPVWSEVSDTLYVIHNVEAIGGGLAVIAGVVTVLQIVSADTTPTVVATLPSTPSGRPFGPAAGFDDLIFFAEAGGIANRVGGVGALYVVTGKDSKYDIALASSLIGSASAAPAVSDALDVYLGQESSTVVAWRDGAAISGSSGGNVPSWAYSLKQDPNNPYSRE